MRHLLGFLVTIFCAVTLTGQSACKKDKETAPKAQETPKSEETATKTATKQAADDGPKEPTKTKAQALSAPTVTLIDAGADPKKTLRFVVKPGDTRTMSLSMAMDMTMEMNGSAMPKQVLPVMETKALVAVKDVSKDGDIRWDFEYTDVVAKGGPDTNPAVVQATQSALSSLKGLKGGGVSTNRGFMKEADFQVPDNVNPQMKQMLDGMRQSLGQLTAPVPEEAIGVGAKWKVNSVISQNGLTINQELLYELVELGKDTARAKVQLTQSADPQKIQNAQIPPGVDARLESLNSSGTGETSFALNQVLPSKGTVEAKMSMAMNIKAGDQAQAMKMEMGMRIDLATN